MGKYLNTTGLKNNNALLYRAGWRKNNTIISQELQVTEKPKQAASVIVFQKPQEKVWLSAITHIWQNNQAGMGQKGVLYYRAKTET